MSAPVRFYGWAIFCLASLVGAAPLQTGASRTEVTTALGEPTGAIVTGSREVLSYPEGKIVLEQNRLVSATFDLATASGRDHADRESAETAGPLPPNVKKAQGTISVTKGKDLGWFRDLEEAKAQAELQNKPMLVLFTSEPAESWNSVFNRTVIYNPAFLQELQQDFVLVKLTCPSASAVDSGDADASAAKRLSEFRNRTIGGTTFPALAIVTADGRRATEVDLHDAENSRDRMAEYVKQSIASAKEQPLRARGGVSGTFVLLALGGLLVVAWLLKH